MPNMRSYGLLALGGLASATIPSNPHASATATLAPSSPRIGSPSLGAFTPAVLPSSTSTPIISYTSLLPYGNGSVGQPRATLRPRAASILVTPPSPTPSSTPQLSVPTLNLVHTLASDLKSLLGTRYGQAIEHTLDMLEYQLSGFLDVHVTTLSHALAAGMPMARIVPLSRPRETLLGLVHGLRNRLEAHDELAALDDVSDLEGYVRWMEETHAVAETWVAAPNCDAEGRRLVELNGV